MRMCLYLCVAVTSILCIHAAQAQVAATQPASLGVHVGQTKVSAIPLADVIALLGEKTHESLYVNWKALEAAGIDRNTKVTVDLEDATLADALKAICDSLDPEQKGVVAFTDDDGVAYLSTGADAHKHAKVTPLPPRGDEVLAKQTVEALDRLMPEINFNQIAASDAIEFVKDITQLSIEVNWDALNEAGIKKATPVTIRIRNLPLHRALRMLLEDVGGGGELLSYVVDGDKIRISTAKDLAKK